MDDKDKRDHLALYSSNCKRCGHLDPDETKKYTTCHYSKGNKFCPAQEVQIVIVGKAQKYAQQLRAARTQRDVQAEAKILQTVGAMSKAFIERFYFYLEESGKK